MFGCAAESSEPFVFETSKMVLRIPRDAEVFGFPETFCDATLESLDEHVERLEEEFGVSVEEPVDVYVRFGLSPRECAGLAAGCYSADRNEIYGRWETLPHELVHAVASRRFPSTPFWNEGVAVAYDWRRTRKDSPRGAVSDSLMADSSSEVDYPAAGHFVRWIRAQHGKESLFRLVDGESTEDVLGESLEMVVADYEANAPYSFDGSHQCFGQQLGLVDELLELETGVECGLANVLNFTRWLGPASFYRLELTRSGDYEVRVLSDDETASVTSVTLAYCLEGTVQEQPESFKVGDVDSTLAYDPARIDMSPGDDPLTLNLEAGSYILKIPQPGAQRTVYFRMAFIGE